jgi:isoleucyl-tRNA synthetase
MIKRADEDYVAQEVEGWAQRFWEKSGAYGKTKALREGGKPYYFVDGPPYTTGAIHLGTAWNKILKDAYVRLMRAKGFNVRDQPGYDMHGLPIEVQVERSLGITNKKEIEKLGIGRFVQTCREFAMDLKDEMTEQFKSLGVWLDWRNPYLTVVNEYMEAVWWTLKKGHQRGLLMKDKSVLEWCPRCETTLAGAEIEFFDETDPSIYVKFSIRKGAEGDLLIWTTTPWTLPANLAVAAHPDFSYARVEFVHDGRKENLWMIADFVEDLMARLEVEDFSIKEKLLGREMVGWEYSHPLKTRVSEQSRIAGEWVHTVIPSEAVSAENTGLVHTAPGHGTEDFELGKAHGLPPFCPVDGRGYFTEDAGEYAGLHVKEGNTTILDHLRISGSLLLQEEVVHRYGHCWRCHTPIVYRATEQWFLRVTELKERMLNEIDKVRWTPEWAGSSREYDWVQNARDWCISRQRYWGIPIPVWECEKCREITVIGSAKELEAGEGYTSGMDLHRPAIDGVTFQCEKCQGTMRRVPDVLDVWFDSGVCSWAQLGYPARKDDFKRWWPVNWICEAHDQTRGWFYTQLAAGVVTFDRSPYESVLMHGWAFGPEGEALSKSAGITLDPVEITQRFGADALRLYLLKASAPWEDINYQEEEVRVANRTLNIFWNVVKFATIYMSIDGFEPEKHEIKQLFDKMRAEDQWLLSRLQRLKVVVDDELEKYNTHKAARELEGFILNDLSRWYVKLIRSRTWKEEEDLSKTCAYTALHEALLTTSRLLVPFAPHLAEKAYQHLDGSLLSVHMTEWPVPDEDFLNSDLEERMATVQDIVEMVNKARQKEGMKLRWPLKRIVIRAGDEAFSRAAESLKDVLLDQTNARKLEVLMPGEEWEGKILVLRPKPDAIGRVYKQWWSKIATMLETRAAEEVKREIDKGQYTIGIEGQAIRIEPSMVEFEERLPDDVVVVGTEAAEIYIDMEMTPELQGEAYAREVIRRVQQMRKELDLDVEDFVNTQIKARDTLRELVHDWRDYIRNETRSRKLEFVEDDVKEEYQVEWNVEGETINIGITPLYIKAAVDEFNRIPGITEAKAIMLFDAGYTTLQALDQASKDELMDIDGIDEIDARKIRNYIDSGEAVRSTTFPCPHCEIELPRGTRECRRCGEAVEEFRECPECGSDVPMASLKCPKCGNVIPFEETPEAKEKIGAMAAIPGLNWSRAAVLYAAGFDIERLRTAPEEELLSVEGMTRAIVRKVMDFIRGEGERTCPLCGATVSVSAESCSRCGTKFAAPAEPVPAPREEEAPAEPEEVEEEVVEFELPELRESFAYLVKEERTDLSYRLLNEAKARGTPAYCVTRVFPDKVREQFGLEGIYILWLSNVGKEDSVRPKDLEKLSLYLEQFINKEGGVVLLDGIEYLITNNNFITVLRLIQSLRDQVSIRNSILLVTVNPSTLDSNQLNLLEREVDQIIEVQE